jgi:hypothetical protein
MPTFDTFRTNIRKICETCQYQHHNGKHIHEKQRIDHTAMQVVHTRQLSPFEHIPTEQIADADPVDPVGPVDPEPAPSKTGCGSSIALTASLISILGLGAFSFLAIKGRKED